MLKFDETTSRLLEDAYQGRDATARRKVNFDNLRVMPGETILDLGCGNGLLTADLARAVGPSGKVIGLDNSADMLAVAQARCEGRGNVDLRLGDALDLPVMDNSIDKLVSVQVFEYFDDTPAALAEAIRVTRPGGRIVIGDIHWDTLVWHSAFPDRMARVLELWDGHLSNRIVPQILPGLMREQGLQLDTVLTSTIVDTVLRPDGIAQMMLHLVSAYLRSNNLMSADTVADWEAEQYEFARTGGFFFSYTHFSVAASLPD